MDDRARAILMVDDDEGLCELVQEFLEREGYEVTTVRDGASGLGAALEGGFALVILDVMLPVLDGFTILDVLLRSAGRIVSRDELTGVLYQRQTTPYERTLDVHVSHLRRKLEGVGWTAIRTVRGQGYICVADA